LISLFVIVSVYSAAAAVVNDSDVILNTSALHVTAVLTAVALATVHLKPFISFGFAILLLIN